MANKAPNSNSTAAESPADLRNNSAISSRFSTVSETAVLIRYDQQQEQADPLLLDKLYGRISWRLMPLFLVVMILNHVDRTNLAYASITMNADLHIGPATYGLGSALFFIPFCFFQIPSNLVVARVGVRRWLAFLLLGWGTVAACMSLIDTVGTFFALRLMLGLFEAGAVPAMWFHMSSFFPADRITKPFTLLTIGILVAQAVSGPVAAGFLAMNGLGGLKGWQWLFLLEGLPTVLMSAVVWCCLPDSPGSAKWLNDGERKLLEADLAQSANKALQHSHSFTAPSAQNQQGQHRSQGQHLADHGVCKLLLSAVCNPWLLVLCLLGVLLASASNTYVFFLPMIINALLQGSTKPLPPAGGAKTSKLLPIILTCIPYTLAAITSWIVATSSQKRRELYIHTAVPAIVGGVFFVLFPFLSRVSMAAGFACLVFVAVSGASSIGPKVAIVHQISAGPSQVVAMPFYNSVVVLGGFAGPYITGIVVQRTGNFAGISVLFGIFLLIFGACLIAMKYIIRWQERKRTAKLNALRVSSDDGDGVAAMAAVVAGNAAAPGAAAGAGPGVKGAVAGDQDAAAVGGLGAVVVQSERDVNVRPRAAIGSEGQTGCRLRGF